MKQLIAAMFAMLSLQACMSVDAKLSVVQDGLVLNGSNGPVTIAQGEYDVQLSVAEKSSSASTLTFKGLNQKFMLTLPDADKLADTVRPVVVTAEQLRQPVQMTFAREAGPDADHFAVTIASKDGSMVLATARFDTGKSRDQAFDKNSNSFLMSFQKVKHSQRAVFIPIDGGIEQPWNDIVNHSAQVLLAPWAYARYSTVRWFISGGDNNDEKKVKDAVDSSPVIDLFAFNHGGQDDYTLNIAANHGLKKHQVRFVYTEGCDSADYLDSFLDNYGAAVAIGHRATSASPLYAFGIMHSWSYGESAHSSMIAGWIQGSALIDLASIATFNQMYKWDFLWPSREEMLHESEPGVMWTDEMTPEQLNIETSAVLKRDTPALNAAHLSFAATYGKDILTTQLKTIADTTTAAAPN